MQDMCAGRGRWAKPQCKSTKVMVIAGRSQLRSENCRTLRTFAEDMKHGRRHRASEQRDNTHTHAEKESTRCSS